MPSFLASGRARVAGHATPGPRIAVDGDLDGDPVGPLAGLAVARGVGGDGGRHAVGGGHQSHRRPRGPATGRPSTWATTARPPRAALRAFTDAAHVMTRTSRAPSSYVNPTAVTWGEPSARSVVSVPTWRSSQERRAPRAAGAAGRAPPPLLDRDGAEHVEPGGPAGGADGGHDADEERDRRG